ncbi:MAG: hypothetical protein U0N91_10235 [Oscillospiraceae bacterium]
MTAQFQIEISFAERNDVINCICNVRKSLRYVSNLSGTFSS